MKNNIEDLMKGARINESVLDFFKNIYVGIFNELFSDSKIEFRKYTETNIPKFPERNLTVNFAEAIKGCFPGAICWFEFQFKKSTEASQNYNNHLDAVIIIPNEGLRFVLICESKRNFPENGLTVIKEDIDRINLNIQCVKNSIKDGDQYDYFGVILLDGWEGTKRLEDTPRNKQYLNHWNKDEIGITFWPEDFRGSKKPFEKHIDFGETKPPVHETIEGKYKIKTIMWPIEPSKNS